MFDTNISEREIDSLEIMMDKHGLDTVMLALSHICSEKADHVRSNWQDENLAKAWDKNAERMCRYKLTPVPGFVS